MRVPFLLRRLITKLLVFYWMLRKFFSPKLNSKSEAKVSIVVPTLCAGAHAGRISDLSLLLRTYIKNQTHQNYEVLVVSDGYNQKVEELVTSLADDKISYFSTTSRSGLWGHPATRLGLKLSTGDYFVRMNDDNKPYSDYLAVLLSGFKDEVAISYARVVFADEARRYWESYFRKSWHYILPNDRDGKLYSDNMDCMNYMVKMDIAKKYKSNWNDLIDADWHFLNAIISGGYKAMFVNWLIGVKC